MCIVGGEQFYGRFLSAHDWRRNLYWNASLKLALFQVHFRYFSHKRPSSQQGAPAQGPQITRESHQFRLHGSTAFSDVVFTESRLSFAICVSCPPEAPQITFFIFGDSETPLEQEFYSNEIWADCDIRPSADWPTVSLAQAALFFVFEFVRKEIEQMIEVIRKVPILSHFSASVMR